MRRSKQLIITLLVLCATALSTAPAAAKGEAKRIKAIDKLAYAVEEIDIVQRAVDKGVLDQALKQYKRAGNYFMSAMKGIRGADPSQDDREQSEAYEDRFRKLDVKGKDLDAETVEAVASLFHEAHEYFDVNAN